MDKFTFGYPSDITQTIIEDKSLIIYRPKLNQVTGSVLATILLHQIIYWAYKSNNHFYKFKEPCNQSLYKPGDSWTEELGFTRWEFETALKKIAKKYNPNNEDIPTDSFVIYYTDIRRLTWYSVNWNMLNTAIEEAFIRKVEIPLYEKRESHFTKSDNPTLHTIYTETTSKNTSSTSSSSPKPSNNIVAENNFDDDDSVVLLKRYGLPQEKINQFSKAFDFDFIKKKLKAVEIKFANGQINNLQGYIITIFDKATTEESDFEKEQISKKELTKKQQQEKEILARKKEQMEDRQYQEYLAITDKLMNEVNVVELRWFAEWLKSQGSIVYNMYKEDGLKSLIVESNYRKYLYEKYFKVDTGA
jgi:hypothetical protein